jgi:superfamily II helicase
MRCSVTTDLLHENYALSPALEIVLLRETMQENQVRKKPLRRAKAFVNERHWRNILAYEEIFEHMREHPIYDLLVAYTLPPITTMKLTICEHCDEVITGQAYRVTSEERGVILLDMMVCAPCAVEAKSLQLRTEKIAAAREQKRVTHQRYHRPRLTVDC